MNMDKAAMSTKAQTLKPNQLKFAMLYATTGNAVQSYIDAGYSAKTAKACAYRLLDNVGIAAEVARLQAEYALNAGVTLAMVMERLKAKAFTNLNDFMTDTGGLKPPGEWPEASRAAILSYDAGGAQSSEKIRLADQTPILMKFLERLAPATAPTAPVVYAQLVQVTVDKMLLELSGPPLPA